MIVPLIERSRHAFPGGFSSPEGFDKFFPKSFRFINMPTSVHIPNIGQLHICKKESKRKLGVEYNRELFMIEDIEGNKAILIINRNEFQPTNREDIQGYKDHEGETTAHVVYGKTSTVGKIQFVQADVEQFGSLDTLAFQNAKLMTTYLEKTGIKSYEVGNNIQLSGSNIVVIEDPKKPGSINSEAMQKMIAFLFGPNGPLSDVLVFPNKGQENLMEQIRITRGRTLLYGPDQDLEHILSVEQFSQLQTELYETAQKMIGNKMSASVIRNFIDALMANFPDVIHRHKQLMDDIEVFIKPGPIIQYLEEQLTGKLKIFFINLP